MVEARLSQLVSILGAFADLRKATASFVCLSVLRAQVAFQWMNFYETWYLRILLKSVKGTQVCSKSCKNNRYVVCRHVYVNDSISLNYSWSEKCCRQHTHFMFDNFFFQQIVPFMKQCGKSMIYDSIIRRMYFACWITKATDTLS
jgi:hypothetical protein